MNANRVRACARARGRAGALVRAACMRPYLQPTKDLVPRDPAENTQTPADAFDRQFNKRDVLFELFIHGSPRLDLNQRKQLLSEFVGLCKISEGLRNNPGWPCPLLAGD